jgi:hypothetical protein
MPTTADAPSHDEENERDRLSLQNHVIRFGNEATSDEVKETILAETSAIQGGDDGIFLCMQSSEILFLSRCTRPKRTPFHFMTSRRRHWGCSSFVRTYVGRSKDHGDSFQPHRPLSCFWSFVFLEKYLIVTNIITQVASFDSSYSTSSMAPLVSCIYGPLFLYRTSHFGLAAQC